jgi:hypothetical protein
MPQFIGAFFYLPQRKEEKVEVAQRVVFLHSLEMPNYFSVRGISIIFA